MTRTRRDRRIRAVLVIGGLTAIATSAPQDFTRESTITVTFGGPETRHVTVRATESAHRPADQFYVIFAAYADGVAMSGAMLNITPDSEALPAQTLRLGGWRCTTCAAGASGARPAPNDDDAGLEQPRPAGRAAPLSSDTGSMPIAVPHALCPERGDCMIGFSIERVALPGDGSSEVRLQITARVQRSGDPAFICPADRDFDSHADVEVTAQ